MTPHKTRFRAIRRSGNLLLAARENLFLGHARRADAVDMSLNRVKNYEIVFALE
jgi:hypothetical protein